MKAQHLIIQFLLFFLIGLAIFLSIGNIFRYQADIFGRDIAESYRKLINTYISSAIIYGFSTCKQCDLFNITIKIENKTADYFHEIYFISSGLNIISKPGEKNYLSSVHNLNYTLKPSSTYASSVKPIILTLNKTKNNLEVK